MLRIQPAMTGECVTAELDRSTTYKFCWLLLACCAVLYDIADGHGRLVEPPSRASMWRYGYATNPDFHDNQLWCGGFETQWRVNGGKCGVCGDRWDAAEPRDHELGGRYASGIIVRRYRPGDVVPVVVELTAAHGGHFEFRVCPVEHHPAENSTIISPVPRDPSPDCLDHNVLQLVSAGDRGGAGWSRRYVVSPRAARMHALDVQLPPGLECKHCLLQWKYHTGHNWGRDVNGTSCLGCGAQEQFYGCADIAIVNSTRRQRPSSSANEVRATQGPVTRPHSTVGTTAIVYPLIGQAETATAAVPRASEPSGSSHAVGPPRMTTAFSAALLPTKQVIQLDGQPHDVVIYSVNAERRELPDNITDMDLIKIWGSSGGGESVYVIPAWYAVVDRLSRRLYAIDPVVYRRLAAAAAKVLAGRWEKTLLKKSGGGLKRSNRDVESTTTAGVQLSQLLTPPKRV